jgi:hypothetical protein
VFGWRQLLKNKVPSAAAVLSLALAIGACVSAFRLVDALLLRPLPVASPEHLHFLTIQQADKKDTSDSFEYPHFRRLRAAVKGDAELMAISYAGRIDVTYGSDQDTEKAYRQYVSGWCLASSGSSRRWVACSPRTMTSSPARIRMLFSRTTIGSGASAAIRKSWDAASAWATTRTKSSVSSSAASPGRRPARSPTSLSPR